MFNMQQIMKQAQVMQKKAEEMQNELKTARVEGHSSGDLISVTLNGKNEFVSIKIKPDAINPENPSSVDADMLETLEDLITVAMKEANNKASKLSEESIKAVTGGIKIPGIF